MTNTPHLCQEPGCGLEFVPVVYKDTGLVRTSHMACPRNADAHKLCKENAELKERIEMAVSILEDVPLHCACCGDFRCHGSSTVSAVDVLQGETP